jgi:hypothetical protein
MMILVLRLFTDHWKQKRPSRACFAIGQERRFAHWPPSRTPHHGRSRTLPKVSIHPHPNGRDKSGPYYFGDKLRLSM